MARRNANGEGTIYHRKDGRWQASGFLLTTSGQPKRLHFYGRTRKEACEKLLAAQAQVQQGTPLPERNWQVGAYLDYWLEKGSRSKRRPLTYRRHESVVRLHLKPGLGKYRLANLSVRVVQGFLDQQRLDGKTVATVHHIRKVLSAALTYAVRQELLTRNVARLVELKPYKPDEAEHWNIEETRKFLQEAKSDLLYPVFVLMALYGLRSGEVRGLRWCDIDFGKRLIHVRQQVQRIEGKLEQVELKTDSSTRDEPLVSAAASVLLDRRARQAVQRATIGEAWRGTGTDKDLVFTTRTGHPIEARNLARSFERLQKKCGLSRITPHGMRHSNGTGLKTLSVPERDIQAILGHSNVRTTRIYEHVDLRDKTEGLTKIERSLFWRANDSKRCRQLLPSADQIVARLTSFISGGSSQTRTGDTRLFRPLLYQTELKRHTLISVSNRLNEVNRFMNDCRKQWLLGAVAVSVAVKIDMASAA
jgi:integrase